MKKILVGFLLFISTAAFAMDHVSQYSVGGGLGANFASPLAKQNFASTVSPGLPYFGIWVRNNPGIPEISTELSYNFIKMGKQNIQSHSFIFTFLSRMMPEKKIHPELGVGMGWSRNFHYYNSGTFNTGIFLVRAGVDYELDSKTDISFLLNHFTVVHETAAEPNMNVLAVVAAINYYFGAPAAVAAPASPAPSVPAKPALTPAIPGPAPEQSNAPSNQPTVKKLKNRKNTQETRPEPDEPDER